MEVVRDQGTPVPDDAPDGYTLQPHGRVRFDFDGRVIVLRRPKLGQMRAIQEQLHEMQDHIADEAKRIADEYGGDLDHERATAKRREHRALDAYAEASYTRVVRGMVQHLGDTDVADDDVPVWFGVPDTVIALLDHFKRAAPPPGAR